MRVTSKGQVTIPQAIREGAGFAPGTEVEFILGDDGVVRLRRAPGQRTAVEEAIEAMRGKAQLKLTTDEIMALTRGEPWEGE